MAKKPDKRNRSTKNFPRAGELVTHDSSIDYSGLITHLPNPDVILKELGLDQRAFGNILADAHLAGTIVQRKSAVKSKLWAINRGLDLTPEAEAVQESLNNLDVYRIISDILEAPFWGMAPLEILWNKPNEKGMIAPLDIVGKPPEWFLFDSHNVLKRKTRFNMIDGEDLPPRKFLNARYNPTYKNPYGDPILSKVFWPVTMKKAGYKFWMMFTEKFGSPLIIGKVKREKDLVEYQRQAQMLSEMVSDAVIVMPDDANVEALDVNKTGGSAGFKDLCQFSNSETSKAVLGQTLTTEATETGTQALGTVHQKVAGDIVSEDTRLVENTINSYIDFFMQINFGSSKDAPRFTLYHEDEIDMTLATRDKTLSETGQIQFTQQYMDKAYGFAPGDIVVRDLSAVETPVESEASDFAESTFQDQQAVDALIDAFGPQELQKQADFVEPILELGLKAENFEDFQKGIIDIFPDVRPVEFEEKFRDELFVSMVWGNLNGIEN